MRYTEEDNYGTSMQTDRKDLMGVRCRERSERDIIQIRQLYSDAFREVVNFIRGYLFTNTERLRSNKRERERERSIQRARRRGIKRKAAIEIERARMKERERW